jgi:hypothetical protein
MPGKKTMRVCAHLGDDRPSGFSASILAFAPEK